MLIEQVGRIFVANHLLGSSLAIFFLEISGQVAIEAHTQPAVGRGIGTRTHRIAPITIVEGHLTRSRHLIERANQRLGTLRRGHVELSAIEAAVIEAIAAASNNRNQGQRLLGDLFGRQITRHRIVERNGQRCGGPDEIDDELIEVMASEPKIVKYLDIPIQHCNSKILKLMNRRGDGDFLRDLFNKLRSRIPNLVIRTSIITGLPGEGEEEFEELCMFLKDQRLQRVGAFPFSPEEGTPAAEMDHPDSEVAHARAEMVESIQSRIMDDYAQQMVGKTLEVLIDGYDEELEQSFGRTYADSPEIDSRVWVGSDEPLTEGKFVMVKIDGIIEGDLSGYIVED